MERPAILLTWPINSDIGDNSKGVLMQEVIEIEIERLDVNYSVVSSRTLKKPRLRDVVHYNVCGNVTVARCLCEIAEDNRILYTQTITDGGFRYRLKFGNERVSVYMSGEI
jgi:hypothetical protein